ncbi:MAG: hydroxyacid dehydrogenase [Lachnospiraceae bacterium]|nr:hydroxyacid dehydrogenase [Lachnospiraceae bacterium]
MHLLVTGAFTWTEDELNKLKALGHEVIFMQQESDLLPCDSEWVDGVICNGLFLSHPIEQFENLRYIQLTSAGYDRIPMDYVKAHGIQIYNARGVYSIPMAEMAICGVLQLYKQSKFFFENQKEHRWVKHRGIQELCGKTVCIVGCGSVGAECAKRFKAFGCRMLGVDIKPYESKLFEEMVSLDEFDSVLGHSDVLVLTLPLTDETRGMMDFEQLKKMKIGAVLVNIARGAVVKTDALMDALGDNLRGAVIDVFEEEPLGADSLLWNMENVIVTPHNSFIGDGNHERMLNVIYRSLEEMA